jgi:hypothetical protein
MYYRGRGGSASSNHRNACCTTCIFVFFLLTVAVAAVYFFYFQPEMQQRRLLKLVGAPATGAHEHGSLVADEYHRQHYYGGGDAESFGAAARKPPAFLHLAMALWRYFLFYPRRAEKSVTARSQHEKAQNESMRIDAVAVPKHRPVCSVFLPVSASHVVPLERASNSDADVLRTSAAVGRPPVPPLLPPPGHLLDFTLNGTVRIAFKYRNDSPRQEKCATASAIPSFFSRATLVAVYKELLLVEKDSKTILLGQAGEERRRAAAAKGKDEAALRLEKLKGSRLREDPTSRTGAASALARLHRRQLELLTLLRDVARTTAPGRSAASPSEAEKESGVVLVVAGGISSAAVEVAALTYLGAKRVVVVSGLSGDKQARLYHDKRMAGITHYELWSRISSEIDEVSSSFADPGDSCRLSELTSLTRCPLEASHDSYGTENSAKLNSSFARLFGSWRARRRKLQGGGGGGPFDFIISYSAVQHEGLGRQGEPVDPQGDMMAVGEMFSLLRPGGRLVLGIPVGNDCVSFNTHRVYGRRRLGLLLLPWIVEQTAGFPSSREATPFVDNDCNGKLESHVLLVLRRPEMGDVSTRRLVDDAVLAGQWASAEGAKVPEFLGSPPLHE